ncbi:MULTISPECIES: MerC domain-containing protein [Pseudoalteromonas]|uniref:MerC domain-containing protein n=1 Tax=Pseudoalteromonas obscura TaxID=3048491 RepID=A0ABT7EKG0_9GAMM|nr:MULTISPECIES: MerC domain-containing protein [Pseudoalteromonas]MBQ4837271.1 MerC domain-containing protein [Pseudoalteromonas luteoviolacea]MDK2595506.1 MerC domain-containing protein [Pseudoalteromonas sp. P94(2023)]
MLGNYQLAGDRVSIGLAVMCLAHCLVLPIAITLLPFLATSFLKEEAFHQVLLVGVLLTSILALYSGCKAHKQWRIFTTGIVGLFTLSVAALFGHDLIGDYGETILTMIGSLIVAYCHINNIRACRNTVCCD